MEIKQKEILPDKLSGLRTYFTDIDPLVPSSANPGAIRKLKLQLLTKEKIVVAASSLFHDIWYKILKNDKGLINSLQNGIIIPAIRSNFGGVNGFFLEKKYPKDNKYFFRENVSHYVSWKLEDNTNWFKDKFFEGLNKKDSVLCKVASISYSEASLIKNNLYSLIGCEDNGHQFLQRKHIEQSAMFLLPEKKAVLIDYANLIYMMSGSIVVKSEGHFPQSNLTKLSLVGNEEKLNNENIFWDIYAEAVFTLLGTAIRITPERLDNLNFENILEIRKSFFKIGFTNDYDTLLKRVKEDVDIDDPDKLILHAHEIATLAVKLRDAFHDNVKNEMSSKDYKVREESLWQIASGLSILSNPILGVTVGILSTLKSMPEITAPFSKSLTSAFEERYQWIHKFINTKVGWSNNQKKSFLEAYKILAQYGLTP